MNIFYEIILEKNLLSSDDFGILNLQSNLKFHNYDTNKSKKILINDFDWTSNTKNFETGINTNFLGSFKNLNYEAKNISPFKEDTTSEFYGAIGLLSKLNLFKNKNNSKHFLQPKMLLRYAPGSMRNQGGGQVLTSANAFSMNRLDVSDNFETGVTSTIGFDYKFQNKRND